MLLKDNNYLFYFNFFFFFLNIIIIIWYDMAKRLFGQPTDLCV